MLELKHIRAVSFDAGGTLITPAAPVGEVYARVAARFGGKGLDPRALDQQFHAVWHQKGEFDYTEESWYEIVRRTFGDAAQTLAEEFYPALYAEFARAENWRVFDDVLPTLDELASHGVPMAVISNWDNRLRPLLESLRLSSFFDVIIPSCEIAFHKPSEVIFEIAIRRLGLPPEAILHVGDHPREDVAGARGAGLQAVHLARGAAHKLPGQISTLLEIPTLVELAGGHLLSLKNS